MVMKNILIPELLGIAIEPTYFDLQHCHINPAEIVFTVKNVGANTIRLGMFSHQGTAYYPSAIAPEAPGLNGRNLLKEFECECRKQNIRLVVYFNSKWVTDLYHQHPDWGVRFNSGPLTYKDWDSAISLMLYPICPCSPFTNYFRKIVREVVGISSPDGIYIDNFAIMPFCKCRFCRERFGKKIPDGKKWNEPETQRYLRWLVKESKEIARGMVAVARSRKPKMPVIFNRGQFWTASDTFSPEDNFTYAHRIADAVHAESAVRFYRESFRHINEQCAFGRAIKLPLWTWVEYGMYPFSYVPSSPEEALIKTAKVLANGGRPMVWNMPCAPRVNLKGMSGVKDVFRLASKYPQFFNNLFFKKFAGVIFSSQSIRAYCRGNKEKLEKYRKTFAGAYELALRCHIPYDFLLDEDIVYEKMKDYRMIMLPDVIHLSPVQCKALERYVKNGGNIFATHQTSLCDRNGKRRKNFMLAEVFGAHFAKGLGPQSEGWCAGYARFNGKHPLSAGIKENPFPIAGNYLAVESRKAIAYLLKRCRYYCDYPQEETEHPAVIARMHGKGKVVYISGEFFRSYHEKGFLEYKEFFARTLAWFTDGVPPVITDLPDTVEVTVTFNRKKAMVIHLVNCSFDETRPVEQIVPVSGRYLKIVTERNYDKAFNLATGKKLEYRREGFYLRIALPSLTGYDVIVLN